jgi:CheY-like chemotaxis protein
MIELIANIIVLIIVIGICLSPIFFGAGIIYWFYIRNLKKNQNPPPTPLESTFEKVRSSIIESTIEPVVKPIGKKRKIYVIEDEPDAFNLFVEVFERAGYEVYGNIDSNIAIQEIKEGYFDLISCGMVMPQPDGIRVLEILKTDEYKEHFKKFMYLTNIGGDIAIEHALKMGADGYLIKADTDPDKLITYVEKLLTENKSVPPLAVDLHSTHIEESIIPTQKETPAFNFDGVKNIFKQLTTQPQRSWRDLLVIPYKRWILEVKQCEEETLKIYDDLANLVDEYLKKKGSSLISLKQKLDRLGGYYSNILYTLECIAEGEVEKYYRGGRGYDNTFSYQLLRDHIDQQIVTQIKEYLRNRVKEIPAPNANTIRELNLASNGMPYAWWDSTGELRENLDMKREDYYWLNEMKYRQTKFLEISQCRIETTKLYLDLLHELEKFIQTNELNKAGSNYLNRLFEKQARYNQSRQSFLKDVFKLCENTVRTVYPGGRLLNTDPEVERIKRRIGIVGSDFVLSKVDELKGKVKQPSDETMKELQGSNPNIWKSRFKEIIDSIDNQNIIKKFHETNAELKIYLQSEKIDEIYLFLCKGYSEHNKIISLYYYYKYCQTVSEPVSLPKTIQTKLFTNKDIEEEYIELLPLKLSGNDLLDKIKNLFTPKRKVVSIDTEKVGKITEKHNTTVGKLSAYIGDDEPDTDESLIIEDTADSSTLDGIFGEIDSGEEDTNLDVEFDSTQLGLLGLFITAGNQLPNDKIEEFAANNNQLPNSLISNLNQVFYNTYEDTLILKEGDTYVVEQEYISLINDITNGSTNKT